MVICNDEGCSAPGSYSALAVYSMPSASGDRWDACGRHLAYFVRLLAKSSPDGSVKVVWRG